LILLIAMANKLLRLHIGCGLVRFPKEEGWINIDASPEVKPDKVARIEKLPFRTESVDEIYTAHTLEHVDDFVKAMREMHRVLKKGGKLNIVVPYAGVVSAFKPQHHFYFSYDTFNPFKKGNYEDWYYGFHFAEVKTKLVFKNFNRIISPLANRKWWLYENSFLSHLFPASEIHVEMIK